MIPSPPLLRINNFRGINLHLDPTEIADNESPDMLNCNIEDGKPNKRTGFEKAFPNSLGAGVVNGDFLFRRKDGTSVRLLAHGTKLYTWSKGVQPTEIYNGLANHRVTFFGMNDKCYLLDGTNYLVYDGTTVSQVTPYIPTLTVSTRPDGGVPQNVPPVFEQFNLLGAGFKQSFSPDGTAKTFQLALKGLDATPVTVVLNGANKVETTDFTVNRTNGTVDFSTAPVSGIDSLQITAYKTQAGFADRIKKCTLAVLFGGANDTRVFVSGNPDFKNQVWRFGVGDATYAPENTFHKLGSDAEKVQGFAKQYDYLVVEKERSKWNIQYEVVDGIANFPSKPINDQVGTLAPRSIQTIENNPISLDKTGVYVLTASNVRDERNVVHISANVDPKLLREPNLDKAVSFDHDRKYWLVVNGNAYIYDYSLKEWYIYDNINANLLSEVDGELYFAADGTMYRFKRETDTDPYTDNGAAINCHWHSKIFNFGADERRKMVDKAFVTLQPNSRTSVDIYYITNKKQSELIKTSRMDLLDFNNIDFTNFSFLTSSFPQEIATKIKAKKITHFQLILKNNKLSESMGITGVALKYIYQSFVK